MSERQYDYDGSTHGFSAMAPQLNPIIDAAIIFARTGTLPNALPSLRPLPQDPVMLIRMGVASAYGKQLVNAMNGLNYDTPQSHALIKIIANNVERYVPEQSMHAKAVPGANLPAKGA